MLSNTNDTDGDATGIGFSMLDNMTYVKGGIFYERTDSGGRGSIHIATTNTTDSTSVGLSDARLTVAKDGNVGIGETTPTSKLEVRSETATHKLVSLNRAASPTAAMYLGNDSGNNAVISSNYSDLIFGRDQSSTLSEWMRIKRDGNVGIGTTSPSNKLSVAGTIEAYATTQNNAVSKGQMLNYAIAKFKPHSQNSGTLAIAQVDDGSSIGMQFTNGAGTANWDIALQPFGGNVAIGKVNPNYNLEVVGTGRFTGNLYNTSTSDDAIKTRFISGAASGDTADGTLYLQYGKTNPVSIGETSSGGLRVAGNVGIGTTSPQAQLEIRNNEAGDGVGGATLRLTRGDITSVAGDPVGTIEFYSTDADTPKVTAYIKSMSEELYGREGSLAFGVSQALNTDATEAMRITNDGNVGIGITSPSAKLTVDGAGYSFIAGYDSGNRRVYIGLDSTGEPSIQGTLSNGTARQISINPSGGNVGIGTAAPGYPLDIVGFANSSSGFRVTDGTIDNRISWSSGNIGFFGTISNHPIAFNTNSAERLRITSAGNVGIGATVPGYKLTVDNDDLNTNNPALYVKNPNSSTAAVIAEFVGDSDSIQIKNIGTGDYAIYNSQQSNGIALYDGTGGVEIKYAGTTTLESDSTGGIKVTGQLSATGDVVAYSSDERLKENIKPIESAVDKIKQLKGVTFDWNEKSEELGFEPSTKTNDVGVIAQDVEAVFPQVVQLAPFDIARGEDGNATSKSGEDYKTVNYARLTAVLIEAIKEQQQQIDELKKQIK